MINFHFPFLRIAFSLSGIYNPLKQSSQISPNFLDLEIILSITFCSSLDIPLKIITLAILGYEEGTGRNEGRLGAFICEGEDDGKLIRTNVGSGLSDDNRITYWAARDNLVGHVVEVRADAVTQNQDGTYSLRFPRFKGFRGFEPGEKL